MTFFPKIHLWATGERYEKSGLPLYEVGMDMSYWDAVIGQVIVRKGAKTDLVSFPGFRRAAGKLGASSAVVHDYLYGKWVPEGYCTREEADAAFLRAMKIEGVGAVARYAMYLAVRLNSARMAAVKTLRGWWQA